MDLKQTSRNTTENSHRNRKQYMYRDTGTVPGTVCSVLCVFIVRLMRSRTEPLSSLSIERERERGALCG